MEREVANFLATGESEEREHRHSLLSQYARGPGPADERVEQSELLNIIAEAVEARNSWKRIPARCCA
jgi:hypothetical protein